MFAWSWTEENQKAKQQIWPTNGVSVVLVLCYIQNVKRKKEQSERTATNPMKCAHV